MDGYSVKDAAIILGVPERRVWELLARGVLAGAPEGPDGMIVFLQPRSSPASAAPSSGPTSASGETAGAKANGNGGSGELSPFRELLTEFRNLTERYGQALLALGEARGEVASLRTRVEVLEARMDLRLPSSPPTATVAWELPEFAAEEAAASVPEAEAFSAEEPMAFETVAPLTDELDAFEADEPLADQVVAEVDESVAGEDEPAAEPMIDLIEEAIFAEPLLEGDEEPILETPVDEIETSLPELAEPEAGEQAAEAAAIEPSEGGEELPEPPRRRARGGRTAIAGFAAALARADDPTLAELPGAEETAAALAALQRDIDASRAGEPVAEPQLEPEPEAIAEPQLEPEPEAIAEPAEFEEIAAAAAVEEAQPEAIDEPEPVGTEVEPVEAAAPAAAATEPAQSSVPSYYSTDVVEPDWFADGDFSWLEAAQAEAMRVEATQAEAAGAPAEPAVEAAVALDQEPEPVAIPEQSADVVAEPEPAQAADAGEMSHAATDVAEEVAGNETEVAFGEHTSTEAAPPDLGHEGFEPSAESQAMAEEEARAAIHEAFDEAPASDERESPEAGPAVAVAEAVAEPEPEIEPEAEWVAEAVAEPEPVPEMVPEPETIREPEAVTEQEVVQEPEAVPEPEAVAEPEAAMAGETAAAEVRADEILADGEDVSESIVEDSPEAEAIQDAFEPEQPPVEDIHAQHEAEVEAEAIQEAFEEPMPAPEWSAAAAPAAADEALAREDQFRDAAGQPSYEPTDQPPPTDEAPRVIDDAPRARGAEATVSAVRGPEEFIAPPPSAPPPVTQPGSVSGEEELMWLGDEFEEADLEVAAQGWRSPDAPSSGAAKASPTLELSDAELTQLAEDEGWDSDEVEAIRRLLGRPSDAPSEAAGPDAPAGSDAPAGRREEPAQGSPSTSPIPEPWSPDPSDPAHDPEWLEGRSGAAAEAYRRLRKLFPS